MNYITRLITKLTSILLFGIILNHASYGQQAIGKIDHSLGENKGSIRSSVHIVGNGPVLASGLPVFVNGQEVTNQPLPGPTSIKSAQIIKKGDPRLVTYGLKGINGVLLIEATDSIRVGQLQRKN